MKFKISSVDNSIDYYKEHLKYFNLECDKFVNNYGREVKVYYIEINSLEELMNLIDSTKEETNEHIIISKDEITLYDGYCE